MAEWCVAPEGSPEGPNRRFGCGLVPPFFREDISKFFYSKCELNFEISDEIPLEFHTCFAWINAIKY